LYAWQADGAGGARFTGAAKTDGKFIQNPQKVGELSPTGTGKDTKFACQSPQTRFRMQALSVDGTFPEPTKAAAK